MPPGFHLKCTPGGTARTARHRPPASGSLLAILRKVTAPLALIASASSHAPDRYASLMTLIYGNEIRTISIGAGRNTRAAKQVGGPL